MAYTFHDFKTQGVPPERLDHWLAQAGWETLLNRKGTTWRKLDPAAQAGASDAAGARAVMLEHASVIKRPVVEWGDLVRRRQRRIQGRRLARPRLTPPAGPGAPDARSRACRSRRHPWPKIAGFAQTGPGLPAWPAAASATRAWPARTPCPATRKPSSP